jgi:hypothetical protein
MDSFPGSNTFLSVASTVGKINNDNFKGTQK